MRIRPSTYKRLRHKGPVDVPTYYWCDDWVFFGVRCNGDGTKQYVRRYRVVNGEMRIDTVGACESTDLHYAREEAFGILVNQCFYTDGGTRMRFMRILVEVSYPPPPLLTPIYLSNRLISKALADKCEVHVLPPDQMESPSAHSKPPR